MAAMGQGQAAGGEGAQNGAAQGDGGQNGDGAQLTQLADQLGQHGTALEEMRTFLQSNPWAAQQQTQDEGADTSTLDLSWLDNPGLDPEQQQQMVQQSVSQLVDQRAQQLIAPLQQQITSDRHEREAHMVGDRYPELATPEMAQKIAGRGGLAEQRAQEFEHRLGIPGLAARLSAEPMWWEDTFVKYKAAELANAEGQGSGDPGAATLESGNGAGPGLSGDDLVKGIMQAGGRGGSVLDRM